MFALVTVHPTLHFQQPRRCSRSARVTGRPPPVCARHEGRAGTLPARPQSGARACPRPAAADDRGPDKRRLPVTPPTENIGDRPAGAAAALVQAFRVRRVNTIASWLPAALP